LNNALKKTKVKTRYCVAVGQQFWQGLNKAQNSLCTRRGCENSVK